MNYPNGENLKRLTAWVPSQLHADASYECNIRSKPGNKYTLQDLVNDAVAIYVAGLKSERIGMSEQSLSKEARHDAPL